jgi:SAM-dependent methyltransferase
VFHLPFAPDSIDGLWNVGVMEHFTDAEIDAMLREFHRVLKPGASLCLFWPGRDSVPQRLLDGVALVSNLLRSKRTDALRFHPDEISRLPSRAEGRRILERAGFHVDRVDAGGRTLFAFKVVIARKTRGFVPVPAPTGGGLS